MVSTQEVDYWRLFQKLEDCAAELSSTQEISRAQVRDLKDQDRQIEVLTQERDNALLRIEELERWLEDADPNDRLYRGGVNPNA